MKIGKMVEKSPDGFIDFYQYHFTIKWQSKDFWLLVQCSPPHHDTIRFISESVSRSVMSDSLQPHRM